MTRELKPCGTLAAYYRHLRRREVPCEACTKANRDAARLARQDKILAPQRRAALAAAVYTGRPRRGTQRAEQLAQLRGAA